MSRVYSFLKKNFCDNPWIILLSFFFLIKPYFLSVNPILNDISNIFMLLVGGGIYFLSFYKNKISRLQIAIFVFMGISLISTLFVSKDIVFWLKYFLQYSTISLYSEFLIKNNTDGFFKNLSILLGALIILNFITFLFFPEGIFSHEVLLLGYDNATIVLLLLGSMFIMFSSYYFYKKIKWWAWIPFLMNLITYYVRWSVGAMIGCIVLLIFFLFFYRKPKWTKILNLRTFYWVTFALFILIVVFGIQKYFSFIIVDVFHKNVTLTGRTLIWQRCFEQIRLHPIFGIGMMVYGERFDMIGIYHAHCNFLNVLLEIGFVGLLSYFYIWHLLIKSLLQNPQHKLVNFLNFTFLSYLVMTLIDVIDNSEVLFIFFNVAYFIPFILRKMEPEPVQKKILLVMDTGQPLPAVMGGAAETLADYYLEENAVFQSYVFDVFSTYHPAVKNLSLNSNVNHYYYINNRSLFFKFKRICKGVYQKITKRKLESVFSYELLHILEVENKRDYYDLVLIENTPSLILNLKKYVSAKYVLHLHNDLGNVRHWQNCFEMYDLVIPCSMFIANRVQEAYPKTRIANVYNGVNEKELLVYKKQREILRKKYGLAQDDIVFGFCGRVCADKGVKELVLAFKNLVKMNAHIKLVIAGNSFFKNSAHTPYICELQELAKGLEGSIIFTGYIEHEEIGQYYSLIDISMHPSIVNEACPLTVLEAQIMGVPIIATDSGGIPELVTKENAILISRANMVHDLEEMMQCLIDDEAKRKKMSKASMKNSKQYYLDVYVEHFYSTVRRVLDGR